MTDYGKIKSCRDITEDQIAEAIESREDTRALLEHAAKIGTPRTGGARVLLLFARMASPSCDWLDGALRVEISSSNDKPDSSNIEAFAEIGAGLKERIFPVIAINVPIEEFVIAVKKFPKAIAPLAFFRPTPRRVVLTAGEVEKIEKLEKPSSAPPAPARRVKTPVPLSLGDLPTVGSGPKSVPPPPAAAHLSEVVMSASQPAPPRIPKFPTKTEVRIGTPPKFPPPARKKLEPAVAAPETVEAKKPKSAPPLPIVEAKKPESVPPPPPPPPVVEPVVEEAKKPEVQMPALGTSPTQPLARIQLKRQQTPATLPRVVEEIDGRSPAAPRKRAVAAKKPFAVPPPPVSVPEPEKADEPAADEPKKGDVDEGWE
ncbi:MAG: hypothetical protein ACXWP4_05040 [Polyangiales bacterium]